MWPHFCWRLLMCRLSIVLLSLPFCWCTEFLCYVNVIGVPAFARNSVTASQLLLASLMLIASLVLLTSLLLLVFSPCLASLLFQFSLLLLSGLHFMCSYNCWFLLLLEAFMTASYCWSGLFCYYTRTSISNVPGVPALVGLPAVVGSLMLLGPCSCWLAAVVGFSVVA